MRAVVCKEFGPARSLTVEELPDPAPAPGQVVVRIEAAGANFPDALFVEGRYQIRPPLPFVPGGELAGRVTDLGEGVDPALLGQRVVAMSLLGAFATAVAVPADDCVVLPDSFDSPRAASFAESFCTAAYALRNRGRLAPGEWVLVLGAGSGVGFAAVQIATALGANVIAGASTVEKRRIALAAGAKLAIDTIIEDVKTTVRELVPQGVDVVLDPIGGTIAEPALRALAVEGRYLVVGFASGTIPAVPFNQILLRNRAVIGAELGGWSRRHPVARRALLVELVEMVGRGDLDPAEPRAYPLEEAGAALTDLLERRITGRAVVIP